MDEVERDPIDVMFLRTTMDPEQMPRAWQRLEATVGLRGRKFFGAFDPSSGEYRVCVQRRGGDDPAGLGLESGVLPGGRYIRERLRGEPPGVYGRIAPAFAALADGREPDPSRPSIEVYRSRDEIDLLLPVTE